MPLVELVLLVNLGSIVLLGLMCASLISTNGKLTHTNKSLTRANIDTNHLYHRSLKDLADTRALLVKERRKWPARGAKGHFIKRGQ